MPAYDFLNDILRPFLRKPMKVSTGRCYAKCAARLEEYFDGMVCTDSQRARRKRVIDGVKVAAYREWRKSQGVQPVTVKAELALASAACNWAVSELNCDFRNPFQGRTISDVDARNVKPDKQHYTKEQARTVLALLDEEDARVLRFCFLTAFRIREALLLTRDRVTPDGRVHFTAEQQKGSRDGYAVLNPAALALIADRGLWAFTRNGEGPIDYFAFWRRFDKARKRAGVPHLRIKHARSTAGQWALDSGATLREVQSFLRHASYATTERHYVSATEDAARAAASKVVL